LCLHFFGFDQFSFLFFCFRSSATSTATLEEIVNRIEFVDAEYREISAKIKLCQQNIKSVEDRLSAMYSQILADMDERCILTSKYDEARMENSTDNLELLVSNMRIRIKEAREEYNQLYNEKEEMISEVSLLLEKKSVLAQDNEDLNEQMTHLVKKEDHVSFFGDL
jgi:chromosome segregation ATPase